MEPDCWLSGACVFGKRRDLFPGRCFPCPPPHHPVAGDRVRRRGREAGRSGDDGGCRARPGALDGEVRYPASRRAAEGPTPRRTTDRRPKALRPEGANPFVRRHVGFLAQEPRWTHGRPPAAPWRNRSLHAQPQRACSSRLRRRRTRSARDEPYGCVVIAHCAALDVRASRARGVGLAHHRTPSGRVWPHRHGRHSARAAPGKRWCRGGRSSPPPGRRIYGASRNCVAAAMSPVRLLSAASHCASEAKHTGADISVSPWFRK